MAEAGQGWEHRLSADTSYLHRFARLTQKTKGPVWAGKRRSRRPAPRSARRKLEARTEGAQAAPVVYDGPESSDHIPRRAEPGHYGGEAGANSRWDRDGAVART